LIKDYSQSTILVVVAHPDDEVLGCAATIRKYIKKGASAHLVVLTGGVGGRFKSGEQASPEIADSQAKLSEELNTAATLVGYSTVTSLGFPDNRLDLVGRMDISLEISKKIVELAPDTVFTHHASDYNWDHTVTFDAVIMAARRNPPEQTPREIRSFEVLSSTERAWQDASTAFHPNVYVEISDELPTKEAAMRAYESEYRLYPHPRSVEAIRILAARRGNEVGIQHAEAFALIRLVEED
jgi:LmbE family N-acetylglucosaminyl deacetylase